MLLLVLSITAYFGLLQCRLRRAEPSYHFADPMAVFGPLQTFIQMRAEDEPERILSLIERGYQSAAWVMKKVQNGSRIVLLPSRHSTLSDPNILCLVQCPCIGQVIV